MARAFTAAAFTASEAPEHDVWPSEIGARPSAAGAGRFVVAGREGALVGVEQPREAPERRLDRAHRGARLDAQRLVVVALVEGEDAADLVPLSLEQSARLLTVGTAASAATAALSATTATAASAASTAAAAAAAANDDAAAAAAAAVAASAAPLYALLCWCC